MNKAPTKMEYEESVRSILDLLWSSFVLLFLLLIDLIHDMVMSWWQGIEGYLWFYLHWLSIASVVGFIAIGVLYVSMWHYWSKKLAKPTI